MSTLAPDPIAKPITDGDAAAPVWFGGDYNPEQWPETTWDEDVVLMRRAGVTMATVGVFSWARLEPRENEFDFGWLDRVLDKLAAAGIRVDLATATASPPPWLAAHYPETLPVTEDGTILWPGSRQHYCPSSPIYRELAARLVGKLVERYRKHPAITYWHINNEYGCHVNRCYCDQSARSFREWLRQKYRSIEALNAAWGTAFWSQAYSEFDEIFPPRSAPTNRNPTQLIDFDRFSSDELLECFRSEAAIIREVTPEIPLTTNFMGFFKPLDYWKWAAEVDFVSDDSYPDPADESSVASAAMVRDLVRSLRDGQSWLLMEQASSAVNWRERNAVKPTGTNRAWSFQAIARGSDGILYFQWRQSVAGAEKFHSALIPHGGSETRVYREVEKLGAEIASLPGISGTRIESRVAIVLDWDSWWAIEQPANPAVTEYLDHVLSWYRELHSRTVTVDFVRPGQDLARYAIVIAPHLMVTTPLIERNLDSYARGGGSLLVTYQSAILDENLHLIGSGYLGELRDTLGITVEEFVPLAVANDRSIAGVPLPTARVESEMLGNFIGHEWTEHIHSTGAEVLASFTEGDLAGSPAITRNRHGDGEAWYIATQPEPSAIASILERLLESAGVVGELAAAIPGVEAVRRGELLFVINHSRVSVHVPVGGRELLTGIDIEELVLEPQGVGIVAPR